MTSVVSLDTFVDALTLALGQAQSRASARRDVYAARIWGEAIDEAHPVLAQERRKARAELAAPIGGTPQ